MVRLLLISILLTGCVAGSIPAAMVPRIGIEGYWFHGKEFSNLDQNIRVVLFDNEAKFRAMAIKTFGYAQGRKIRGFAVWSEEGCTIYIKDPEWVYEPEVLGHELAHCLWGKFHTE